jgi:hypothetical protein
MNTKKLLLLFTTSLVLGMSLICKDPQPVQAKCRNWDPTCKIKKSIPRISSVLLMGLAVAGSMLMTTSPIYAKCKWGITGCNVGGDTRVIQGVRPHYETNKFDFKAKQEAGGWILAWSDDISETDAIKGVVAAGISVYTGSPAFGLWVDNLVDKTIQSTTRSAGVRFPDNIQRQVSNIAQEVISAAIQGKSAKSALKSFDTVDFKAGAIRYTGGNYLGKQLVGPHTWGMKIYLGFRVR